ncbi:peptidoglycan/LPS O-acetylase OafA/YrhL [Microbacteriaceae bacterium SG_E_30_P1]|uniref:Peptidoglycan/LPS O-acetylase OafA/YrhL n=1 Tax=Antiquaquibacter oligotrophicus TaxID=2880260 RepID=A0ABT6KPX4_9MICO|nr:acyltransferase family protein [Antiquaquibacter oligotrophicus]MDH6182038.1 peptidoglycan/LPS O-acetylase OafA/YrhL [Antiquaquibacter oligotrophicus]UDF12294.1 acyltransferase [Antiquaquibacter oligotrophicus]
MTEARAGRFLPEIQALRALAVVLVVLYHVWPERLPGGFIGVDVFFVISGYLITDHLVREYEGRGTISLTRFWARRIRRLLPAAFVVLAACVVLVFIVLPEVVRQETLRQIAAASGYVLNWVLAFDAVDYLAAGNEPTVVQHYWTLSVEEQFYLGWPLLLVIVGAVLLRVRRHRVSATALAGWSALAVIVVSFGFSVYLTWFTPKLAFFATTTRAWEFAAGGLLAVIVVRWPSLVERLRSQRLVASTSALTVLGVALIVAASFLLDGDSAFPGWIAAVPVLGALLVILGGRPRALGLGPIVSWRPIQYLGDISYSVYLWHWPILLTLVVLTARRPTLLEGVAIVAATLVLAALTKHFVEDPGRRSALLTRRRGAFALAAIGVVAFVGVWVGTGAVAASQAQADRAALERAIADTEGCFGANALLGSGECADPFLLTPDVDLAAAANDLAYEDWCLTWYDEEWVSCEIGATDGAETWALVGDSHAASMVEAFDDYFADRDVTIVTYMRYGCDGYRLPNGVEALTDDERQDADCREWAERVQRELASRDDISTVMFLNRTSLYASEGRPDDRRLTVENITATWEPLIGGGKRVVAIKDWPVTEGDSIPVCLSAHVGEQGPCSVPRDVGMPYDPQDDAAAETGAELIDLTDAFCDDERCYSVIGGVVVYPDHNHITGTYSRTLMPYLGSLLTGR